MQFESLRIIMFPVWTCLFLLLEPVARTKSPQCGIRPTETSEEERAVSSRKNDDVVELERRVVGGHESQKGHNPWLVNLRQSVWERGHIVPDDKFSPSCGSVLIHERFVLTASHCARHAIALNPNIKGSQSVTSLHVNDFHSHERESGERVRWAKRVFRHEQYYRPTEIHDIALIELNEPVQDVPPACISREALGEGEKATVMGWGHTQVRYTGADSLRGSLPSSLIQNSQHRESQNQLQPEIPHEVSVEMGIISGANCSGVMDIPNNQSVFCAGSLEGGLDACQGDSGGPMLKERGGAVEVVGVVSWGIGCGQPGKLGVYTNVSYYYDWINDHIHKNKDEKNIAQQENQLE